MNTSVNLLELKYIIVWSMSVFDFCIANSYTCTVNHKCGSTFVIITLENLDGFFKIFALL